MSIGYDQLSRNGYKILSTPMFEATGVSLQDIAKPHHIIAQTNTPTWTQLASSLWWLDFNSAIPEYLQIAAAASADLDFTTQNFSLAWWMNPDVLADSFIFCRGATMTDGYDVQLLASGAVRVSTHQAASTEVTDSAAAMAVAGTPAYWGVSRSGASIRILKNGIDVSSVIGVHVNPLTANRKFLAGIYNDEVSAPFDGKIGIPRAWLNWNVSEYEHRLNYEMERKWFGI